MNEKPSVTQVAPREEPVALSYGGIPVQPPASTAAATAEESEESPFLARLHQWVGRYF